MQSSHSVLLKAVRMACTYLFSSQNVRSLLDLAKGTFSQRLAYYSKDQTVSKQSTTLTTAEGYPLEDYLSTTRPDSSHRSAKDWVGNAQDDLFTLRDSETVT